MRLALERTLEEDVLRLQERLGAGRGVGAADEMVTGDDLAILFGIGTVRAEPGSNEDDDEEGHEDDDEEEEEEKAW